MNKIRIHFEPDGLHWAAAGITVLAFLLMFIAGILIGSPTGPLVMWGIFTVFMSGLLIAAMILKDRTIEVEYDKHTVRWKWLWKEYKIELSEIEKFVLRVREYNMKGAVIRRLELRFYPPESDDLWDEPNLNDRIDSDSIIQMAEGKADDLPLMQLYNFLADEYPEKAKGFVKW